MSKDDIAILPQTLPNYGKGPMRGPVHLLTVDDPAAKSGVATYLCSKIDKHVNHIEMIGVLKVGAGAPNINEDLYSVFVKEKLVEMFFPWNKVISVQNLTYKSK